MATLERTTILKIAEGVKAREESFGLLVVSKTAPAMSLNLDSKFVWELINGQNTIAEIHEAVSKKYRSDKIEENVNKILEGFLKLGLVSEM